MSDTRSTFSRPVWLVLFLLTLVGGGWLHREQRKLRREVAALRESVAVMSAATTGPGEVSPASSVADKSHADKSLADELLALRGEVAALRRERAPSGQVKGGEGAGATASAKVALPPQLRRGWLEAGGLPPGVLSTFQEQLGGAPFEGAHFKQAEGRFFYSTEAKLTDGRHLELALDSEGNVVKRTLEQPMEALTPAVRQAAQAALGESRDPHRIHEVFEEGRTVFRLTSKNPEQAAIHVFSPEGQLLRSELIRREDRP